MCSRSGLAEPLEDTLDTFPYLANAAFKGELPLIAASSNGHAGAVKVLLKYGAVVDAQDMKEKSALMAASLNGHTEVIEVLLAHGAKISLESPSNGMTAFSAACKEGELKSLEVLLAHGADVESNDINGWSALFVSAKDYHVVRRYHADIVKYLLQHGANPNVKDMTGTTPLIKASQKGSTEIVRVLLEGGANVDIQDDDGSSALFFSALSGHAEIVDLLLKHGAQVNLKAEFEKNALIVASFNGYAEIVKTLLNHGAKDTNSFALLAAILKGRHEVVQLFCDYGGRAHRSAVEIARDRTALLKLFKQALLSANLPDVHHVSEDSTEGENIEELMETQKLILETVNNIHFKSMMSHGIANVEDRSLTLRVLFREFMELFLAADWQSIGALLNLPAVQLRAIKLENHLVRNCMREMLEAWLKTTYPPPTWEKLVEAVEVLDKSKAQHLYRKFCI